MPLPSDPPPPFPADASLPPLLPDAAMVQWIKDGEHLRLLSIFHYVVGALAILFSSLFIFHIFFGVLMLSNSRFFDSPPFVDPVASPGPTASPDETAVTPPASTPAARPTHRLKVHGDHPPEVFGYLMVGLGSLVVLFGWTTGALLIYSGRCLARRTRRVFSMVMAGISCLQVPFGTILGVFTLVALQRPSVQALYAANGPK